VGMKASKQAFSASFGWIRLENMVQLISRSQGGQVGYTPKLHPNNTGSTPAQDNSKNNKGPLRVCL